MDIFAHTLWTNAVFYNKYPRDRKRRYWAAFFGVAPDLIVFTPAFLYSIFFGGHYGPPLLNSTIWVYRYAQQGYNYTHSLVIFALAMVVVTLLRRGKQYWPMWGWALHIGIDIFSHRGFYETPFLFPLSGYKFDYGVSWAHPTFMFINYSAIAVFYILIFTVWKKKS